MDIILSQSLPIIALVVIGFLLKEVGIIRRGDGHVMARLIINTTLPAVLFVSLARADIKPSGLLVLALCGASIPLVLHQLAIYLSRLMGLDREVAGVVVVSTMVTNVGFFLLPFFLAFYGTEGVSRLAAFDLGNSLVANSYAYYVATRYGQGSGVGLRTALKKVLGLPTLWANIAGITVNLAGIALPATLSKILDPLAAANTPLAMLTLGSFIELRFRNLKPMLVASGIRMGLGWGMGQILVLGLGLTGLERTAVSMAAAMPIGLVVMVYASLEGLDTEFAAATISFTLLVAMILTPILLSLY
jgi:predicted permease